MSYAGERWDFIVDATAEVGNYWMRFKGLMDCDERFTKAFEVAILHYDKADDNEPKGEPTYDNTLHTGIVCTTEIICTHFIIYNTLQLSYFICKIISAIKRIE